MADPGTLTVLVAEDSRLQRRVLVAHLQRLGVGAVVEADDCPRTVAALEAEGAPFDLCFLDLNMPGDDTDGLLRRLVGTRRLGPLTITSAESAESLEAAEATCAALGLRRLETTPKPVDPAALAALLASL